MGNDFARNIVVFGADNTSSSHVDNRHNNFLVLGEGPTDDIKGSAGTAEKTFSINFSILKTKFCLSLHYNDANSHLFVNRKEIYKFKTDNRNVSFLTQFCLGSISEKFDANKSK